MVRPGGQGAGRRATHSRPETIARPQQAEIPARARSLAPSISPPLLLCCGGFPPISSSPAAAADAASSSSSSPSSPKNRLRHFFFPPRPRRSSPRPPQPPPNLGCFQASDSASSTPPSVGRFSSSSLPSLLPFLPPSPHLPLLFQVRPSVRPSNRPQISFLFLLQSSPSLSSVVAVAATANATAQSQLTNKSDDVVVFVNVPKNIPLKRNLHPA